MVKRILSETLLALGIFQIYLVLEKFIYTQQWHFEFNFDLLFFFLLLACCNALLRKYYYRSPKS